MVGSAPRNQRASLISGFSIFDNKLAVTDTAGWLYNMWCFSGTFPDLLSLGNQLLDHKVCDDPRYGFSLYLSYFGFMCFPSIYVHFSHIRCFCDCPKCYYVLHFKTFFWRWCNFFFTSTIHSLSVPFFLSLPVVISFHRRKLYLLASYYLSLCHSLFIFWVPIYEKT